MQTKWSNFGKGEMSDVFIQGRSNFLNAKKNYLKGILENKMIWMACSEKAKFALKKKKSHQRHKDVEEAYAQTLEK